MTKSGARRRKYGKQYYAPQSNPCCPHPTTLLYEALCMKDLFPDFVTQKTYIFYLIDNQIFVSLCHLLLGDTKGFLTMFVRKKKYPSGNIGVIVVEKTGGKMKELATIGVAYNEDEVEILVNEAKEWISRENSRRYPQLDLSERNVRHVTVSVKRSVVFCPM